ncbi:MAG: PHP domain-containing protein [Christensenellaceae bacterium]|nr:PHP domain-containing protein [Christensenellaceae bacterium]
MIGDLHCHSTFSDGFNTTSQIVDFACRKKLTHISLTDHDTMDGVTQIINEAQEKNLCVIPGVECSSMDYRRGRSVHMLCYAPHKANALKKFLNVTLKRRREAKLTMADKLAKLYPITRSDVLKASENSKSIYEVHLIAPLAAMGYTSTICGSLLKELIGKKGSCYVPIVYPDVYETVDIIRSTGGLAVIAHPGQFDSLELAEELAKKGVLSGIECYHPRNNKEVTQKALAICEHYNLIATGGTDFHGMYSATPYPIGSFTTHNEQLKRLLDLIKFTL